MAPRFLVRGAGTEGASCCVVASTGGKFTSLRKSQAAALSSSSTSSSKRVIGLCQSRRRRSSSAREERRAGTTTAAVTVESEERKKEEQELESGPESVYVCGATGRTGLRVVKELAKAGLQVKCGCRSAQKFEETFSSFVSGGGDDGEGENKLGDISFEALDLESQETLKSGVSGADVVVCCLGAPEDEFNFENPKRIDGDGTIALIDEAVRSGGVKHFVLVTSLGTGRFGWPASVLNLFFNVLYHKRRAEEHLINSGLNYTIVRPGGMEKPTDEYYKENKMVVKEENTQFGGQVSRLQVSWCVKDAVMNPSSSSNKILEVVTDKIKTDKSKGKEKKKEEGENGIFNVISSLLFGKESEEKEGEKEGEKTSDFEAYDLSVANQISKIRSLGNPTLEGTPAWYSSQYAYKPTKIDTFMKVMSFRGSAPEAINGRLAMLAVVALLGEEHVNGHGITQQITDQYLSVAMIFGSVIFASLVPLVKEVEISHAELGPFKAFSEKLNGRLAMLGFSYFWFTESFSSSKDDKTKLAIDTVGQTASTALDAIKHVDVKSAGILTAVLLSLLAVSAGATFSSFKLFGAEREE
eukprot:CAMPEP_0197469878 /NCGR_PEP_ID=MMETSP1309-20131121/388_1 /TAXON_ID=464262 /ORGANISM="Genus nov. species nov., Strain RCC998" /LENGTH=582 /DNA_ID=CAMNT_0043006211 /DNA_START=53 /DNA_END=1801 /DNA_ORIENTATION=-